MASYKESIDKASTTKITDLNLDCLEKIFMLLNVNDLFNVANLNKSLQIVAAYVYGRRFSEYPPTLLLVFVKHIF